MRWRETVTRVRGAIGLGPADRDLEQELGFHLDMLERGPLGRGRSTPREHHGSMTEWCTPPGPKPNPAPRSTI